jgi:phosphate transport system protein
MTHSHIVQEFDQDLQALAGSIAAMGGFATTQLSDSVRALLYGDMALARSVIEHDRQLDALHRNIMIAASSLIVRRQPMANDLDEVLADFRIAEELERVGDLAKNVAKRATAINHTNFPVDMVNRLQQLSYLASEQLKGSLESYQVRDAEMALRMRKHDEKIDVLHTTIFREIVAQMAADTSCVIDFVHLLFCAKNIERIGDHAAHVAEAAYFSITGSEPSQERRRLDDSSLLNKNDTLSQSG